MSEHSASPSLELPLNRRRFIAASATTAGALVVGFQFGGTTLAHGAERGAFTPNAHVRVGADGYVTIVVSLVEMGQGTFTSIPMLIAEELEVDLAQVRVEQAPADEKAYGHPLFGLQVTGGSASIQAAWARLRQAGATAKLMLVTAAAQGWNVPPAECSARSGLVTHGPTGRSARYAALVGRAAALPVPAEAPLKHPADFRLVGTPAHRTDTPSKVNGTAQFGVDAKVKGMRVAAIAVCPVIGGKLGQVDSARARLVKGVRAVLVSDDAVAVVADHYGAAKKGLGALSIQWQDGPAANFSNKLWGEQLAGALKTRGQVAASSGDFQKVNASAARRHTAVYEAPPLAHAAMEPLNCTLHVRKNGCDVWLGTQAPARVQAMVAEAVGLAPEQVVVHNFLLGGGFGRKLDADYVVTAAKLVRQVDHPVKVIFSREEDIQHDVYRPYFRDELSAALDDQGRLIGFGHRFAGSSVIARYAPAWLNNGIDGDAVHTAESPYDVPNKYVEFVRHEPPAGLTTGNWRGVGPTHHAFVNECFIDELAALASVDPVAYRERLLTRNPRALAVLRLAASKAGWGSPLAAGRGRGVSVVDAWGSHACLVSEVSVTKDGALRVHRAVCAVDCGLAVNPDGVEAQMQGGIVFGLTAVLHGRLTFEGGRVLQSNFHDYPPLRINDMPAVEVHQIKNGEPPGGVGEIGTAVVAPSLLNALHAATGKRFRTYPVSDEQLKSA